MKSAIRVAKTQPVQKFPFPHIKKKGKIFFNKSFFYFFAMQIK
jgi:hypothetical protein